ncbi:MAG: hypothetical protein AAF623_05395 [Planctomycetota bacterium]
MFTQQVQTMGFESDADVLDHLIEYHYKRVGRPFRFCHPKDLLLQCKEFCDFLRRPKYLTSDILELAILNYFSGMAGQLHI